MKEKIVNGKLTLLPLSRPPQDRKLILMSMYSNRAEFEDTHGNRYGVRHRTIKKGFDVESALCIGSTGKGPRDECL